MSALLFLALFAAAQASRADTPPAGCKLFVYPVNENGQVDKVPVLTPRHISSMNFLGIDPNTGFRQWRVTLTPEGAALNTTYSKEHIRKKIAIFCDSKEVARPEIVAPSSDTFVVILPDTMP